MKPSARIKLLRKLSVPIEEIRLLLKGEVSFSQTISGQIERLEKEIQNARVMSALCERLKNENVDLNSLDASRYLGEMDKMEMQGTKFVDIEKEDINRKKRTGAVAGASVFCMLMLAVLGGLIYLCVSKLVPFFPLLIPMVIVLCLMIGTVVVLIQRIKEINGGEEYDARKY